MSDLNKPVKNVPDGLNDAFENIRRSFKKFKKGSVLMFIAGFTLLVTFWTAWFTVQPEEIIDIHP